MKYLMLAMGLCALALASPSEANTRHVKPISPKYSATALAGQAKGEVQVFGTLATVGSFEYSVASLVTIANASLKHYPQVLHDQTVAFQAGKLTQQQLLVTKDLVQAKINAAVVIRDLLKKANETCHQNAAGKCMGDEVTAQRLADQARAVMAQASLSLN